MKSLLVLIFLLVSPLANAFSGQLKSTTDGYPAKLGPPTEQLIPYMTLEMSDRTKLSKPWAVQWKGYALSNLESHYQPEKFYGDVHEAFIEYKKRTTKIQVGLNTVNWGVVDGASPVDTVNTKAMFHPLRTLRQGSPMVQTQFGGESLNLDLIYIPVQRQPQLPARDSRWLPREVLISNLVADGASIQLPTPLEYTYHRPITYTHALNNNAGAKLASHIGSWDLQLTHFEGASPSPKLGLNAQFDFGSTANTYVARSPIELVPINYRQSVTGFGFAWAGEKWIFRGESAYESSITDDIDIQPWAWNNVLAVETNIEVGSRAITVLGQFYYSRNPDGGDNMISSYTRLFDQTGVLGMRIPYSDDLTISASLLYETYTQGVFALAGFDNKLSDHLRWGLSYASFSAAKEGLLKTYAKDSHGTLDLTYFF